MVDLVCLGWCVSPALHQRSPPWKEGPKLRNQIRHTPVAEWGRVCARRGRFNGGWGVEGVVSSLMSGPRLKGSVPRKWAIKIEDLFIFLLPPFPLWIWHGVQKSGRLFGNDLGGTAQPHGSPAHELGFINGNAVSIIMALLFNQRYLGGSWVSWMLPICPDGSPSV